MGDDTAFREEVQRLSTWCAENNLILNTSKTKELIIDYRRNKPDLDNKHQGASEKGPTETVFPKVPQEEQSSGKNAVDLLSLHH